MEINMQEYTVKQCEFLTRKAKYIFGDIVEYAAYRASYVNEYEDESDAIHGIDDFIQNVDNESNIIESDSDIDIVIKFTNGNEVVFHLSDNGHFGRPEDIIL
jgi:hypothetical protein